MFEHEQILVTRGARSGLPVVVAVHSTVLGPAIGGCRIWPYRQWQDGLADALRLSASMTVKCAAAGLPHGGGKAVVVLPLGRCLDLGTRRAVLRDVGDVVESFDGGYLTGPDVGTTAADMVTIAERTSHVCCRPESAGGCGDSSPPTATGVISAIRAACRHLFGSGELYGRTVSIVGLGRVGGRVAVQLAAAGARLVVADIDPTRRALADEVGATWVDPQLALTAEADVLVPAALGGVLTADLVPHLRCRAIVGPANNQLADDHVAEELHERGICWAPDYVVSAGGVTYAVMRDLHGYGHEQAISRILGIGDTLTDVLVAAEQERLTPHQAAQRLAAARLRAVSGPQWATSPERNASAGPAVQPAELAANLSLAS